MTPKRIITAAVVTSGEKGDGQFLETLVNQSRENGVTFKKGTGDTAYSGKESLKLAKRAHFQLHSKLHPIISNGSRTSGQTWDFNKDAGMFVRPPGFMAARVARTGKTRSRNQSRTYYFDTHHRRVCPQQPECYQLRRRDKSL